MGIATIVLTSPACQASIQRVRMSFDGRVPRSRSTVCWVGAVEVIAWRARCSALLTAAVNSALQRARTVIDSDAPTQQTVLRDLGDEAIGAIVTRWADAWQAGDVDVIVAMLTEDARYSMPPLPEWYRGPDEIRAFLIRGPLQSRWRFLPTTANGQLAFGTYLWDESAVRYVPGGLDVLAIRDGRVAEIVAFLTADFTRFGLPASLPR